MIRLALAALLLASSPADERPNIVFILADDLGVNDLSCYGRADQPTPHLDKLATEGARFTSAYCAQPICSPSRAAILTGKAPARLRLTTFLPGRGNHPSQLLLNAPSPPGLPLEEVTLAERLKAAGYATAAVGKWHLGNKGLQPTDQGFDVHHPGQANTKPSATEGSKGEHDLTAAAERFLEAHKEKPFFLYLAHNTPHIPYDAPADPRPNAFNPVYAAVIRTMDDVVGRLMAKIDALGLREKTIVVFTSDNGGLHVLEMAKTPATHNTPFRAGKGFVYEGGLRIPLIVRWPGKVKASVVDTPVIGTDWTPTFLDLAGVKTEDAFDGQSVAPVLRGETAGSIRPFFWHFPQYTNQGGRPAGAVREGDWKLVEHYEDGRLELFNLAKDVGETADLAAQEPGRVAALRGKLEAWRRAVKADVNPPNPDYSPSAAKPLYGDVDVSRLAPDKSSSAMAEALDAWRKGMNKPGPAGGGALILHARDAKVTGAKLQYEAPPHKDTLGYWVNPADTAEWSFDVPKAGAYAVEVLQGCGKGCGGSEVELAFGATSLTFKVEETGHFQRFVPRTVGTVTLEKGPATLKLSAKSKPGPAVMDLRRVTLKAD
ncbi:MAG TPA: sulfatase-like hydrolase/transferase [Planctomycetota bacterium]